MKKMFFSLVGAAVLALAGTGCITTVDGHKSAGVPFRKDKIVSRYQLPLEQIFVAAKEVLAGEKGGLGVLQAENRVNNSLVAKVNTRMVYVKITEVEPNINEVVVQVRTDAGWSDLDWAAEIDKQIALRLQVAQSLPAAPTAPK
ncbi:MAG: hypothetical protein EB141_07545 [Verrucomicrobia bacterium]|nr:hypothetical protein [Verrucomicrobiota bacterium]NBU10313.1 hypothetical protein [Pseudomonadota bacterium]NDA66490.1 hypothetical protein [Verrucomicrobiota bacterium]NDB75482.1 hypothetical protein [Verrucomicrobiota bacterium]NDD38422.1 hypothetical protein [Verrucomicrobiota bacterium]